MPTSKLELMELLVDTIMGVPINSGNEQRTTQDRSALASYFYAPGAQVDASSITLAELLDDQPNLLSALAAFHEGVDNIATAQIIRQIASFLYDPTVSLDDAEHRTRRFLDYVYPVV